MKYWQQNLCSFSFISGVSGTSLFNSVSLMAYNVFYTSVPVLVSVIDKDLSEASVMQHPQILFYCQAGRYAWLIVSKSGFTISEVNCSYVYAYLLISFFSRFRLLNPSTFAGWFGRSLFHVSTVISNLLNWVQFLHYFKSHKNLLCKLHT